MPIDVMDKISGFHSLRRRAWPPAAMAKPHELPRGLFAQFRARRQNQDAAERRAEFHHLLTTGHIF
ncbi:hypothetical protein ACLHDD_15840 [Pantoea sp. NSTU24]|uniref:hypothetical protein n=1 Tax=Pantoea sp. NSTU24 TaxID=3391144 RepID=UPI003D0555A1